MWASLGVSGCVRGAATDCVTLVMLCLAGASHPGC